MKKSFSEIKVGDLVRRDEASPFYKSSTSGFVKMSEPEKKTYLSSNGIYLVVKVKKTSIRAVSTTQPDPNENFSYQNGHAILKKNTPNLEVISSENNLK